MEKKKDRGREHGEWQWTERRGLTGRNNGRRCDQNVKKQVEGWSKNRGMERGEKRGEGGDQGIEKQRLHLKYKNGDKKWKAGVMESG